MVYLHVCNLRLQFNYVAISYLPNELNNFRTTDVLKTRFLRKQSAICPPA